MHIDVPELHCTMDNNICFRTASSSRWLCRWENLLHLFTARDYHCHDKIAWDCFICHLNLTKMELHNLPCVSQKGIASCLQQLKSSLLQWHYLHWAFPYVTKISIFSDVLNWNMATYYGPLPNVKGQGFGNTTNLISSPWHHSALFPQSVLEDAPNFLQQILGV